MTVTVDRVKCACSDCVCIIGVDQGVKQFQAVSDSTIYVLRADGTLYREQMGAGYFNGDIPCPFFN